MSVLGDAYIRTHTLRHGGHIPQIFVRLRPAEHLHLECLERQHADDVRFLFDLHTQSDTVVPARLVVRRVRDGVPRTTEIAISLTHDDYRHWFQKTRSVPFWKLVLVLQGATHHIVHRLTQNGKGMYSTNILDEPADRSHAFVEGTYRA